MLRIEQVDVKELHASVDDVAMPSPACRTILCFFVVFAALFLHSGVAVASPTLADARAQWPFLADLISVPDDLAGLEPVAVDPGSAENVVRSTTPGVYAVAVDDQTRLRDANGVLLDQRPALTSTQSWAGTVLAVDAPGQYGMLSIPSANSSSIIFGDDLFSAIQVRLSRRADVQPVVGSGFAYYEGVAPGVSQLMVVGPDEIKENLVVESSTAGESFRYELTLPEMLSVSQVDDTIEIRDIDERVVMTITAPIAYDRHGQPIELALTHIPEQSAFTVSFADPPAADAYPVLVDPTFSRVTAINDYDGAEMSAGRVDVDFCGNLGGVTDDMHPTETGSGSFQACSTINTWNELSTSGAAATDKFSFTSGQTDGLSLQARGAVSKGDTASVSIKAPADMGIYASVFRGHTGTALTKHSCELRYAQPPLGDAFMDPFDLAASTRDNRFWGGRPDGAGTSTWATFPVTWGTEQLPDYHVDNPTSSPANTHMRGFLGMRRDEDLGALDGQFRFDVRYQPSAVSMVIRATDTTTSGAGISCSSDGHWTVTFFDDKEPTTASKPSVLDAADPGRVWFRRERIAEINTQTSPVRSLDGKLEDKGSGIRRGRLINDGFPRAWVSTCTTGDVAPGDRPGDPNDKADFPYATTDAAGKTPCPLATTNESYSANEHLLADGRGDHTLSWQAEDFSGRFSAVDPGPTYTSKYWVDWDEPTCTALWLPQRPAANGYFANGTGTLRISYSDDYYPNNGSGVNRVAVNSAHGASPSLGVNPAGGHLDIPYQLPNTTGDYTVSADVFDIAGYKSAAPCSIVVRVDADAPPTVVPEFVRGASGARVRFHPTFDARSGTSHYIWNATDAAGNMLCPGVNRRIDQPAGATTATWLESDLCQHAAGQEVRYSVRVIDALGNEVTASTSGRVDSQPDVAISPIDPAESRFQDAADRLFERYSALAHEGADRELPVEVIVARLSDSNSSTDLTELNPIDVADPSRGATREYANATLFVRDAVAASPAAGANITWSFGTNATDPTDRITIADYSGAHPTSCAQGGVGTDVRTQYWILDCKESKFDVATGELTLYLIPLVDADGTRPTPDQRYNVRVTVRDRRQEADYKFLRDSATAAISAIDAAPDFNGSTDIGDTVVDRIAPHVDLIGPDEGQISYVGADFRTPGIGGNSQSPVLDGETYDTNPLSGLTNPTTQYASGVRFVDYKIDRWRVDTNTQDATIGCVQSSWDRLNPSLRINDPRSATANTDVPTSDRSDDPNTTTPEPHYQCEFPNMIEGDYAVELCSKDRVGNRSCTNSRLIVDRTAPCAAAPIAVRGATGQRLRFAPVTCDVAGNAVHGTRDLSQVQRYEWKAALTPGNNAPAVCSGVFIQPAAPLPAWIETDLCRNNGVDFAPGTRLYWTLTTFDFAQNNITATTTETVDVRPVIARPAFENNDIRYDSFNGTVYANGTTNRDLIADVTDFNGSADLDSVNEKDPADPVRTATNDWAIATVFVTDTLGDDPATPRDDLDASIAVEWAFGTAASPNTATVTLRDGSATPPSCLAGSADVLTTTYWTLSCARATRASITNGYRLTLPLHPRDTQTADTTRYPTPDQRYHVTGFVRDRKQPADYKHLSNAADGANDVDAAPPADTNASLADDVDMGLLVLDRIVPDGVLTYPNVDPITTTSNQNPELRARGRDVNPGETLAPLSLRDIITSPQTLDPTGMARIEWDVYMHDEDPDQLGPVVAAPDAVCKSQDAGNNVERTCMWTGAPFGNYDVTSTFTDIAGNHWTTPKRWLRIEPDVCDNIPGIQPTVPEGFVIDENGDCVRDECPNIDGLQRQIPDGYYKDAAGLCQPDVCPNIDGIQVEIPDGYVKDEHGDCVRDICPNVDGIQERVPNGLALNENGDCVPDVCPNIDGNQDRIPNGMVIDENGNCVTPPEPDLCDNIDGIQRQVPNGLVRLPDGRCVPDLCTNIDGIQETVPEGFVRLRGECFRLPPPPPPTDSYQGQYPHVEPLGILSSTMETRNEPEDGFPDDPEDFQIDFGKANLHLQCGRDSATKLIVCPDWNGEFDFTYIGSPAFSWRVRDLSKGDPVNSARGETQFSWSRDSVQDGVTVRDVWTVTKVQAELTVNGVVYPDATIQVVSHTTGGLQNQPQSGYVSLWVWRTADTAQPWDYHAEGAMQVDCQATNNCPDVPVIPDP